MAGFMSVFFNFRKMEIGKMYNVYWDARLKQYWGEVGVKQFMRYTVRNALVEDP